MSLVVESVLGREILDSRGFPTVEAEVRLRGGARGRAAVPSGASTGKLEALELRDGDPLRYDGKGVHNAVGNINGEISSCLRGMDGSNQRAADLAMIGLDNTVNKSRLGANAMLAVSLALARAVARQLVVPLYRHIAALHGNLNPTRLPVPQMNIVNGGAHADNNVDFQEFMIVPVGQTSFSEALRAGAEIFHKLRLVLIAQGLQTGVGDEGGFAPDFASNESVVAAVLQAIDDAGYRVGDEIYLGLDVASSEFYSAGHYTLNSEGRKFTTPEFIDLICDWISRFPIISVEDALSEEDWDGWKGLSERVKNQVQLTGDDLFVTNPAILKRGIDQGLANSILIKPNQIGTLSETLDAVALAQGHSYGVTISHRSGETEDTTIADLAVGVGAGQIKTGSLSRSERVAKYNRLLRIEQELGPQARYAGMAGFPHRVNH
ncbi:phosphopyruvate hydratase [Gammaproteobacteria bacterium]|jgi:enolase|nr:phosphopyruvate hydratase [Gammaproteobacteria bacterium]